MADSRKERSSCQKQDSRKRPREHDPEEGTSKEPCSKSRATGHSSASRSSVPRPSKDEQRRHNAYEKAFQKAHSASCPSSEPTVAVTPPTPPAISEDLSQPSLNPELSPDRSVHGGPVSDPDVAAVFPGSEISPSPGPEPEQAQSPAVPASSNNGQQFPEIPPILAGLISTAIRQGISEGLQKKASSPSSSSSGSHRSLSRAPEAHQEVQDTREPAEAEDSASQDSLSEGEIPVDQDLSEDEGLEPDQPSFVGLFRPQMFRSLLYKARAVTKLGGSQPSATSTVPTPDLASALFQESTVQAEVIPAPKLFSDVVNRQWAFPSTGPSQTI